jgi:putative CocE/NonD family hydrolase
LESAWLNVRSQPLHAPYEELSAFDNPGLPPYLREWISHREPGPYWSEQDISARLDRIAVPALHLAGWYDTYVEGSIAGYLSLRKHAGTQLARDHQYLVAGPWVHIPWGDRIGETKLGESANLNTDQILLRWCNHWLKDSDEFDAEPRIRYFALGPNEWRTCPEWKEEARFPLYLRSRGAANSRKGDGVLTTSSPDSEEPRDVFVYDPEVPVTAPGGLPAQAGPLDQAAIEMGNNLLVYTSQPAVQAMEFLGHPRVGLYAVTSAAHADITAKLVRVTQDGSGQFLCIGIARSSWLFKHAAYQADTIHKWEFTLEPIAFVLGVGERLRLEIASSAFPLYDRNPSTAVSPQSASPWNWARSTQQVLHTLDHPSAISLPVVGAPAW